MFTASIAGTTMSVTAVNYGVLQAGQTIVGVGVASGTSVSAYGTGTGGTGTYTITPTQTVGSETMQTASNGKSRLVPFQFSTDQGAILELSAGMVRIWEGATEGSWSLGLALQVPFSESGGEEEEEEAGLFRALARPLLLLEETRQTLQQLQGFLPSL
jgi:hypothetical protein